MIAKFDLNKDLILRKSQEFFKNSSSLIPKIGCELEFFLFKKGGNLEIPDDSVINDFICKIAELVKSRFSLIYLIEKEQGASQIEAKFKFTDDLALLCEQVNDFREYIISESSNMSLESCFRAQPLKSDCGNSLQFNISLHDEVGDNIFLKDEGVLIESVNNLLHMTNYMMIFLSPNEDDYKRYDFELNNNLFKGGKYTSPINLSYGVDNRTCAVRLADHGKRLEYRVASANAKTDLCVAAMLLVISDQKNISTYKQVYGNAFEKKYGHDELCNSLNRANDYFLNETNIIRKNFLRFLAL